MKRYTAFFFLILAMTAGSLTGMVVATLKSERMAAGVTVHGVDVSHLTIREARDKVSPTIKQVREQPVTLKIKDKEWRVSLQDLGMSPDPDRTLAEAYAVGRSGNRIQQFIVKRFPSGPDKDIGIYVAFDSNKLEAGLNKIGREVQKPHQNAKLTIVDGRFIMQPERSGVKLDVAKCAKDIQASVAPGLEEPIHLSLIEDKPEITAADLRGIDGLLAGFTTTFPAWRANRTHNIQLAAKPLNGIVVKQGEVFSFNDVVGPRLKSLGYLEAPIFINGELEPGTGGGICQVSSTLYNAALLANLEIVNRRHHSSPVPYVPKGRDATVAYGLIDLKFRNSSSAPLYITAKTSGSQLTVNIYGATADKKEVEIVTSDLARLPHKTVEVQSASAAQGSRVVGRAGHDGYSLNVYRVIKEDGVEVKRERVSKDVYRPLNTRVVVGSAN